MFACCKISACVALRGRRPTRHPAHLGVKKDFAKIWMTHGVIFGSGGGGCLRSNFGGHFFMFMYFFGISSLEKWAKLSPSRGRPLRHTSKRLFQILWKCSCLSGPAEIPPPPYSWCGAFVGSAWASDACRAMVARWASSERWLHGSFPTPQVKTGSRQPWEFLDLDAPQTFVCEVSELSKRQALAKFWD